MAAVAKLKALLGMDNKQFKAGMRDSQTQAKSFQGSIASIGRTIAVAFSIGAVVAFTKSVIGFASEIRHTADNLNVSTDALQSLNSQALKYGVTVEDLQKSLAKLRQSQGKVVEGDKEYIDSLKLLNINLKEFGEANTDRALELLAQAYVKAGSSALAYSAVQDLLGRGTKKMTAFLEELAQTGLDAMIQSSKDAGNVIEEDVITTLELAGTRLEQLGLKMKVWGANVLQVLATAGEAWNGYYRAVSEGVLEPVGLSPSAQADAERLGLGGTPGEVDELDKEDPKLIAKLKAKLSALRKAMLFGRMEKQEQLIDMEARLSSLSTKNATTEEQRLNIVIERFKLFEKILKIRKDIESSATKAAAKDQSELNKITALKDSARDEIAAIQNSAFSRIAEMQGRDINVQGQGIQADSMAEVGGFVGPQRGGLGIADRQIKLAAERTRVQNDIKLLTVEMNASVKAIEQNTSPTGGL